MCFMEVRILSRSSRIIILLLEHLLFDLNRSTSPLSSKVKDICTTQPLPFLLLRFIPFICVNCSTLTFGAQQRRGALQEVSDLLQRALLPAADAALGVMATRRGGALTTGRRNRRKWSFRTVKVKQTGFKWWTEEAEVQIDFLFCLDLAPEENFSCFDLS